MNKEKYNLIYKKIKEFISVKDPGGLIEYASAPLDEYDSYIPSLISRMEKLDTEDNILEAVKEIFDFGYDVNKNQEEFAGYLYSLMDK